MAKTGNPKPASRQSSELDYNRLLGLEKTMAEPGKVRKAAGRILNKAGTEEGRCKPLELPKLFGFEKFEAVRGNARAAAGRLLNKAGVEDSKV